ncbi:spore photoproduct lyase family protein [Candidatus Poribacteria bacterium]
MYPLTPMKVYMLDRVQNDPACTARMGRMLDAIGMDTNDVVCITEENLPEVMGELQNLWPPKSVPPGQIETYMRPLVFTTMELGDTRPDLKPLLQRCPEGTPLSYVNNVFGRITSTVNWHPHGADQQRNQVCWPTQNFGTMTGCPHGCHYCGDGKSGKFITIALNLEDYMERVVGPAIEKYQWNKCFRMIGWGADLMAFEPEYGLFDLFTRKLAEHDGIYGHFHTASDNVDWIADLPYKDRLLGVWSITCETVARDLEPGSPSAIDRIEAGRKCQEMGIPVRYKFKPIIPIRNWREEYASIIEQALKRSNPESIGFCVIMWMDMDSLLSRVDASLLDTEYVDAANAASEQLKDAKTGPFPHHVRAEIYRFLINEARRWDKDVLLYLSTESREMWDELKDELGQDPNSYVCACSSVAIPGGRSALSSDLRYSTYSPTPS